MWKLVPTLKVLSREKQIMKLRGYLLSNISNGARKFLTEAYACESEWGGRLQTPVVQKVNIDELYQALDQKFTRDGKASVIDVDLFANAVRDDTYADELEDVIHKLRLSSNTSNTLPSTTHAVVRYFLQTEQYDSLIRILDDRLNYGIFPDNYCLCLLLDTLIKKNKITEAARVSAIHTLQEDWSNPLVTALALYACHLYVQNPNPWEGEPQEEDSGEEIKVRVRYLRNPYFDDHFDLRDPQLLVGKTLAAIGATVHDAVGITYHLVGLGLYNKWEKVISFLQRLLKSNVKQCVYKSGLTLFEETFSKHLNDENDPEAKIRQELQSLLKELEAKQLLTDDDLERAVSSKVQQAVASEEHSLIKTQQKLYEEWQINRDKLLKVELEEAKRQKRIAAIKLEKEMLYQKEQELFFFDNEEKMDLLLEQHAAKEAEKEGSEVKKNEQTSDEETYIPPDIRKA